jgi:hypothetical protein
MAAALMRFHSKLVFASLFFNHSYSFFHFESEHLRFPLLQSAINNQSALTMFHTASIQGHLMPNIIDPALKDKTSVDHSSRAFCIQDEGPQSHSAGPDQ